MLFLNLNSHGVDNTFFFFQQSWSIDDVAAQCNGRCYMLLGAMDIRCSAASAAKF